MRFNARLALSAVVVVAASILASTALADTTPPPSLAAFSTQLDLQGNFLGGCVGTGIVPFSQDGTSSDDGGSTGYSGSYQFDGSVSFASDVADSASATFTITADNGTVVTGSWTYPSAHSGASDLGPCPKALQVDIWGDYSATITLPDGSAWHDQGIARLSALEQGGTALTFDDMNLVPVYVPTSNSGGQAKLIAALGQVQALLAGASKRDAGKLGDVAKKLTDSVAASNWSSPTTLDPKRGEKVFDDTKAAAQALAGLAPDIAQAIAATDRGLAAAAVAACTDPKKQAQAQKELDAGDAAAAAGKPDAIDHWKNAWKKASGA